MVKKQIWASLKCIHVDTNLEIEFMMKYIDLEYDDLGSWEKYLTRSAGWQNRKYDPGGLKLIFFKFFLLLRYVFIVRQLYVYWSGSLWVAICVDML